MNLRPSSKDVALYLLIVLSSGCTAQQKRIVELTRFAAPPDWAEPPVRTSLPEYLGDGIKLEFAADSSRSLLAWSIPLDVPGNYLIQPVHEVVIDERGQIVASVQAGNDLPQSFAASFPRVAWRQPQYAFLNGIKDLNAWGFSADGKYTITDRYTSNDRRPEHRVIELWDRASKALVWSKPSPCGFFGTSMPEQIVFERYRGQDAILMALDGDEAVVLAAVDGSVLDRFTYGPPNTDESEAAYRKKFHLHELESAGFSASEVDLDLQRRLVACGDLHSRRVRVVQLDPPHNLVVELNADDPPNRPWGGCWYVFRVRFAGGKYLIVDYHFGGRGTSRVYDSTEIYEVGTWQRCWYQNDAETAAVTISPDGARLALRRGRVLEIGPFRPQTYDKTPSIRNVTPLSKQL